MKMDLKLLKELQLPENAEYYKKLQEKAKWEHMGLLSVLYSWGDPREWKYCKERTRQSTNYEKDDEEK